MTTSSPITVSEENFSGTLAATDAYSIEYSKTDASAATLTVSSSSKATSMEFTLPKEMEEGKVIFAVGEFTTGINISSDVEITLKSVSVYSKNIITPIVPIVIWEGKHALGSWDNGYSIKYTYENFEKTTINSKLRFYYSEKQENAQIQLADVETINVVDDLGYVDVVITETYIEKLKPSDGAKESWPYLNGQNMTITKIVLLPAPTE